MHKITAPHHLVRYSPAFPNILIILGGGKSSGTDISENYMDQKTQNLAQNDQKCIFWAQIGRFERCKGGLKFGNRKGMKDPFP